MIVLVTGGSGGLGSVVCERLATKGNGVAVACLNHHAIAADIASRANAQGARAIALPFDVTDRDAIGSAVDTIVDEFGGLDAIVLAAARNTKALLADLSLENAMEMYNVNVQGVMNCVTAALPYLMASAQGRIVTFSSVVARAASTGMTGYAATKGAVEALTRALAVELGPKRITVNAVAPGYIAAGLGRDAVAANEDWLHRRLPLRRAGDAGDVAAAVSFLLSSAAAYVTGVVLPVDGGLGAGSSRETTRKVLR